MSYSEIAACVLKKKTIEKMDAKSVIVFARCNMNVSETARKLHYHRNSLVYHFSRVKKITGLDPLNFFDLSELYTIALEILSDEYDPL